jgi:hypothetical protein
MQVRRRCCANEAIALNGVRRRGARDEGDVRRVRSRLIASLMDTDALAYRGCVRRCVFVVVME